MTVSGGLAGLKIVQHRAKTLVGLPLYRFAQILGDIFGFADETQSQNDCIFVER